MTPKQALVCGGGGAYGAFQAGVTQALFHGESPTTHGRPLAPEVFTGTSIGAFNAAFLVSRWERPWAAAANELAATWSEQLSANGCSTGAFRVRFNPLDLLIPRYFPKNPLTALTRAVDDVGAFARQGLKRLRRVLGKRQLPVEHLLDLFLYGNWIFSFKEWERVLATTIDFAQIQHAPQSLQITATRWRDGALQLFSNRDLTPENGPAAIKASAAVPGFPPCRVGDEHYIDGAVRMYAPVRPAIAAGAQEIHLLEMNLAVATAPVDGEENAVEALYRGLAIFWGAAVTREIARVRAYNQAIALIQQPTAASAAGGDLPADAIHRLLAAAGAIGTGCSAPTLTPITLHRYFPHTPYDRTLSLTNFDPARIRALIAQGREETRQHDCTTCGCVLP